MNINQLTQIGVSNELAEKILNIQKDEMKEFIPKHRFDEIVTAKNNLTEQLHSANNQIESMKSLASDKEKLAAQIEKYQQDFAAKEAEYEKAMKKITKSNLIKVALLSAENRPYDVDIVNGLINADKVTLDDKGEKIIGGLEEQLKALREGKPFLFSVGAGNDDPLGKIPPDGLKPQPNNISDFGKRLAAQKLASMGIKKEDK